jgi:aryl-alcohol dehydrogenase-like predicted oxidoreductase
MAQVALTWVRQKVGVAAHIIGFSKPEQLAEAIAGLDLVLLPDHVQRLERPYVPHVPVDH